MRQPFSGTAERIFMKLSPNDRGECSLKRCATAWRKSCRRLVNGECYALRNLRYDSSAITRGRHVIYAMTCGITRGHHRRLHYTTMRRRIDVI